MAEEICELIGNKISNRIAKNSPQNNSQKEEKSLEIPQNVYIFPEKKIEDY